MVLCTQLAGGGLVIGDDAGISGAILYAWNKILVGDRVFFGADCAVYDSDFHPLEPLARSRFDFNSIATAPVIIESDVCIGARAMVLKGRTIRVGTVVGARALVTAD